MSSAASSLGRRVLQTVLPALVGGGVGYAYARASLPAEFFSNSSLPAMYAACGAAILILSVRLATVIRVIVAEWRARTPRRPPEP